MDYFKLFTVIGILFSIALGLANLWISYHERKKGIREYLFKEQIDFFKRLSAQFVVISYLFDEVIFERNLTESIDDNLEKEINKLERLFDENVLLLPTAETFDIVSDVIDQAGNLHLVLIEKKGLVDRKEFDHFYEAHFKAIEDLRDYYKVEELSQETLSLSRKSARRKE